MNFLLNTIKVVIFSNLLVSLCVAAYTHLTYLIFNLPGESAWTVCTMVFCFTFTTYNGQRIFRLSNYRDMGERLKWVVRYQKVLTAFSLMTGVTGLICAYILGPSTWMVLLITGTVSLFYVVPIPFMNKALRNIPYLKVFVIAIVWGAIIVGLPFANSMTQFVFNEQLAHGFLSCCLFILAITLPFDVRDLQYDQRDEIKTLPQLLNVKGTIVLSHVLLIGSFTTLYLAKIASDTLIPLGVGYFVSAGIVSFTSKEREELFYAGWIESTVLIVWLSTFMTVRLFLI